MGLDFGITIKARTREGARYLADNFANLDRDYDDPTKYEFTYWRNNYDVRSKVLNALSYKKYEGNGGSFELNSIEDLVNVMEVFKYLLIEKNWNDVNHEWLYSVRAIAETVFNFGRLIEDIENEEEVEIFDLRIELYDSY